MKLKSLLPLIIIVAILAAVVAVKKMNQRQPTMIEQVGLVSLLPQGITKGDLVKFEMYVGAKPDEKIVLAMDADASRWRVASHFNAPAKADKVRDFADAVGGLEGEFRSAAASDADLEPFNLSEQKAFHVLAYKKDSDTPALHVLVGATPGTKTVFMRTEGKNDVFVEDSNLRQLAGLYGEDTEKALEADPWFDNQVADLNKDEINKIALKSPDKELVFELQEKPGTPTPEEAKSETPGETPEQKEAPKPEYQWALAKGGPGGAFKQAGLDALLRKLDSVTANGIVDPAKKAEWGLEPAAFSCVVSFKEGKPDVVIEGGRPQGDGDGYIRVASNTEDIVYKFNKYSFNQLWPKGAELFDLPKLQLDAASVDRVEMQEPAGKTVLVKKDGAWSVEEPGADLPVQTSALDGVGRALAAWKAEDYAEDAANTGLDAPTRTVTFSTAAGESHTVALGNPSQYFDGVYARLDAGPTVLAMGKMDVDKIFVPRKNLYDRKVFDFTEDDIAGVQIERADDSYTIERKDDAWTVTIAGASAEANSSACNDLVTAIAELDAADILFGKSALEGEPAATIRLTLKSGGGATVRIGPDQGGTQALAVDGKKQAFAIAAADAQSILPASASLKKPEAPPAAQPAEGGAAPQAAAPADAAAPAPLEVTVTPPDATAATPAPSK